MTRSFHKVTFTAQEVLDLLEEIPNPEDFENRFIELAEERSRQPQTRIELTADQAMFLLHCINFSTDSGVLRAVPGGPQMAMACALTLGPAANRPIIERRAADGS